MKPIFCLSVILAASNVSFAGAYNNLIYETDISSGVQWLPSTVADYGTKEADNAVPEGGVKYELYTMLATSPYTSYLLDSKTVGAYFPAAELARGT